MTSTMTEAPPLTDNKKRLRGKYVSTEDLLLYQSDPKRDEKLGWIATTSSGEKCSDTVVCRECRQILVEIATVHLQRHRLTQKTYHANRPAAPMLSPPAHANVNKAARKYIARNRPKVRANSANWRKKPESAPKIKGQSDRAKKKRRSNPGPHRAVDREWYAKRKIQRATEAQLQLFLADPTKLDYVVCLEDGCRAKLRDIGCAHLPKIHSLTWEQYQERHPGFPTKAIRKQGQGSRNTKKQALHIAAARLYDQLEKGNSEIASWALVAKRLTPEDYEKDPDGAADRLRLGAAYVRKKFPALFLASQTTT